MSYERRSVVIIGSFAVVVVAFFVLVIATLARAPIAARLAGAPEEIPVISTRLSVKLFFTAGYVPARFLHRFMGRSACRGWAGGPENETEDLFAAAFRERAWILAVAIVPPVLVLVARVVVFGALGTPADLPVGADRS